MYNLTVAIAHTFFVGEEQWLVHNASKCAFISRGGLIYDVGGKEGNRYDHIVQHLYENADKKVHSVFSVSKVPTSAYIVDFLDKAWANPKKYLEVKPDQPVGRYESWIIDMGEQVGTKGETYIRMVFKPGTTEIITAYPVLKP
jgi:hypothetical protein